MPDPFANITDLLARGQVIPDGQEYALAQLLDDASEHLRGVIGNRVWPTTQSMIVLWAHPGWQWLEIPIVPLISIDSVTVASTDPWMLMYLPPRGILVERFDNTIRVAGPSKVTLVVTHGLATPPADLVSWTCVLASQVFDSMQELGTLGGGGVTSIAMEDYRKTFGPDTGAFTLPPRVEDALRARYGGGGIVTESWQ